ncbi:hypothetical protein [Brevibacterium jeotgali]|uniref:Uncharacterized protein n=1 Tax=Brevibacterium jeotgali TaxID=1262550 RepID=A0A2H1L8N2_9MICO|nr:hypothetical protein [Brevibacterium jeotgali]TWC03508.1 hypothetical protein FB108_2237 [Brevibacterium jeotgali]SMY13254.1 hypothetical protein BJEO58_02866 [Brevibacterium jeotgali]
MSRDPKTKTWQFICIAGAIIGVVCMVVVVILGMNTGRIVAGTPDDLVAVEDSDELLTGLEPGRTFYLYAPEAADIERGPGIFDDAGGPLDEISAPQGWPGDCEFDGPDLYVFDTPRIDAPIDVDGVPYVPILMLMNGSAPDADYTAECAADDLLVGTSVDSKEFQVHGMFWPALLVGIIGLLAVLVGAVALAVLRSPTARRR